MKRFDLNANSSSEDDKPNPVLYWLVVAGASILCIGLLGASLYGGWAA